MTINDSSNLHPEQELSAYRALKRVVVLVIGISVVLIGIVMLILPGPGIAGIFAGLAILATEFVWAKKVLHAAKEKMQQTYDSARSKMKNAD